MVGDVITVETDANPSVSEFHWKVNGEEFSTSGSVAIGEDFVGEPVEITCMVINAIIGDLQGNDTPSCVYTVKSKKGLKIY